MKNRKTIFMAFLTIVSVSLHGFYSHGTNYLCLYYGPAYKINGLFYNSFNFSYEKYSFTCTHARVKGYSGRLDYLQNNDFEVSVSYFKCIGLSRNQTVFPYLALSPTLFHFNNSYGCNLKPEIGLRLFGYVSDNLSVMALASYSYDIPILKDNKFTAGRHDLTIKIGLGFDLSAFKRKKVVATFE